jgi:AcrR family transcriptional regulator
MISLAEGSERYVPGQVWTRSRPASRRAARPILDRDTIVKGAIELLDRDGLDGLSMRQLGNHLNVGATSLYWHVANKEELLDLTFDEVMGEMPDPSASGSDDWRDEVTLMLSELRRIMLRHPWYVRLYGRPSFGPHAIAFNANLLGALKRAGFEDALLDHALSAVSLYVVGAVMNELAWGNWLSLPRAQLEAMMSYIDGAISEHPDYALYLRGYLYTADPQTVLQGRFSTGLQSLLDGLAIRLEAK